MNVVKIAQKQAIVSAIESAKGDGLTVMFDGTTDLAHEVKPLVLLVATSSALYLCDIAFHNPAVPENADNLLPKIRVFAQEWLPGSLCDHVLWVNTDNQSTMDKLCAMLTCREGLFPNARHLGCLAHGVNRIGAILLDKANRDPISTLLLAAQHCRAF